MSGGKVGVGLGLGGAGAHVQPDRWPLYLHGRIEPAARFRLERIDQLHLARIHCAYCHGMLKPSISLLGSVAERVSVDGQMLVDYLSDMHTMREEERA